jgi:hypothetical protein
MQGWSTSANRRRDRRAQPVGITRAQRRREVAMEHNVG